MAGIATRNRLRHFLEKLCRKADVLNWTCSMFYCKHKKSPWYINHACGFHCNLKVVSQINVGIYKSVQLSYTQNCAIECFLSYKTSELPTYNNFLIVQKTLGKKIYWWTYRCLCGNEIRCIKYLLVTKHLDSESYTYFITNLK